MSKQVTDLRVLAGKYKGRVLRSPRSEQTHPMGAREKNALFNIIGPKLVNSRVLDLFAGTGALGIEALSRGAKEVVLVEKSAKIAQNIQENLRRLGLKWQFLASSWPEQATENASGYQTKVFAESAQNFMLRAEYEEFFDIILADPPYDQFETPEIQAVLGRLHKFLSKDGVVALSYPAKLATPQLAGLELISDRRYAGAGIGIYAYK